MALTEKSRSALYHGLTTIVDDQQAVEEMLSYFPARDVEEPVTKEFLRAEMSDLRVEMSDLRTEMASMEIRIIDRMDTKLDALDQKLTSKLDVLDQKFDQQLTSKIDVLDQKFDQKLTSKFDALDQKFGARFDRLSAYAIGGNIATAATLAGVIFMALRF